MNSSKKCCARPPEPAGSVEARCCGCFDQVKQIKKNNSLLCNSIHCDFWANEVRIGLKNNRESLAILIFGPGDSI